VSPKGENYPQYIAAVNVNRKKFNSKKRKSDVVEEPAEFLPIEAKPGTSPNQQEEFNGRMNPMQLPPSLMKPFNFPHQLRMFPKAGPNQMVVPTSFLLELFQSSYGMKKTMKEPEDGSHPLPHENQPSWALDNFTAPLFETAPSDPSFECPTSTSTAGPESRHPFNWHVDAFPYEAAQTTQEPPHHEASSLW
jgi:hypothetical protein